MLSAATRLTRRDEFATAVRQGRRAACGSVVVHLARLDALAAPPVVGPAVGPTIVGPTISAGPKIGFVVGRPVGGSVVRHRVQRRLRHLMRARLPGVPSGALVVVRALPAAASASSETLGADLDAALRRLLGPRPAATGSGERS